MRLLHALLIIACIVAVAAIAPVADAQCPGSILPNVSGYGQFSQFSAGYGAVDQFTPHSAFLSDFRAVRFFDGFGRVRVRFEPVNRALFRTFGLFGDVHFDGVPHLVRGNVVTVVDVRGRRLAIRIR
jgi:hypothetical protein